MSAVGRKRDVRQSLGLRWSISERPVRPLTVGKHCAHLTRRSVNNVAPSFGADVWIGALGPIDHALGSRNQTPGSDEPAGRTWRGRGRIVRKDSDQRRQEQRTKQPGYLAYPRFRSCVWDERTTRP
jgi:hypothetical protein